MRNNHAEVPQVCIHCGDSVKPGSGKFVNRVPADDGYVCWECMMDPCEDCGEVDDLQTIDYFHEDLTPKHVCSSCYEAYESHGMICDCGNYRSRCPNCKDSNS